MGNTALTAAAFAISILSAAFTGWYAVTTARQHHRDTEPRIEVTWAGRGPRDGLAFRHVGGPALRNVTVIVRTNAKGERPIIGLSVRDQPEASTISLGPMKPGDTTIARVARDPSHHGEVLLRVHCTPAGWRPWRRRGWDPVARVDIRSTKVTSY